MITVGLAGGLGNQLFQYFFGIDMANKLNTGLQVRIDEKNKVASVISDIFMNIKVINGATEPNIFWNIYQKIHKSSGIGLLPLLRYSNYYSSDQIGYDPKVYFLRDNTFYSGYFQTYKHLESSSLTTLVSNMTIYSGSNEYSRKINSIKEEEPIVVHIRRGDYRDHSNSIGLLSGIYYRNAISQAREMVGDRKIYYMSDDNAFSAKLLESIGVYKAEPLGLPEGRGAHETMFLGQVASVNVLANSTFAWWSGYLNHDSIKIAPKKWFKSLRDPVALIPNHWHKIESSWDA